MRLYKVHKFYYQLSNTLLPPRDPQPEEVAPAAEAAVHETARDVLILLQKLGFSARDAKHIHEALFTHYWYDFGMRDIFRINKVIYWWIQTNVEPVWYKAQQLPPPALPPSVWVPVAIVAIAVVVAILVAPEFEEVHRWWPPRPLYIATYEGDIWFMTLVGVDRYQRPYYHVITHLPSKLVGRTYEGLHPPTITDVLHFAGSLDFRCWQLPWFRSYRAQRAETDFVGFLSQVSSWVYQLRGPFRDPWAPVGPMTVPVDEWNVDISPCGPYPDPVF